MLNRRGHPLKLRDLVVCHLDSENGPERVVWAAAPEWTIEDLPNVGIRPDRYYRPVPLPGTNYLPYTGALMTVDPAGTGTDETTYTITKTLNGLVFLLDAGGFPPGQGHSPETLEDIAKLAQKYKVNKIVIEANFGDGMYAKLLQPHLMARYPVGVEEIKHNVQKERLYATPSNRSSKLTGSWSTNPSCRRTSTAHRGTASSTISGINSSSN